MITQTQFKDFAKQVGAKAALSLVAAALSEKARAASDSESAYLLYEQAQLIRHSISCEAERQPHNWQSIASLEESLSSITPVGKEKP